MERRKPFKIVITGYLPEEVYTEIQRQILTGEFQREMDDGSNKIKATIEIGKKEAE